MTPSRRLREAPPCELRRDGFARQVRDGQRGDGPSHDVRCSKARQACLVGADEERARLMESDASLVHQRLQSFYEIAWDRHDPFLAPLAAQEDLRSWAIQLEVASIDANGFRNARASARQEKQKRPIAPAARRLPIRRIDTSVNLVSGQMMRDFDVRSFKRDSKNALGDSQRRWVVRRHMMEK